MQQWVRDKLLELYPSLLPDDVRSTPMGVTGEDVQLSPQARSFFPFTVECKSRKSFAIYKDFEQASGHRKDVPGILFIRADRKQPLVILDADLFLQIWKNQCKS
jgi:hypothetical protein